MGPSGFKLKSKDKFIKYGSIQLSPRNKKYEDYFTCSFKDFPAFFHSEDFSSAKFAETPRLKVSIERPPEPPFTDLLFCEELLRRSVSKRRYSLPLPFSILMIEPISLNTLSEKYVKKCT